MSSAAFSTVCTQSGGGFRGELVRCGNPHCEVHGAFTHVAVAFLQAGERPTIHTLRHLWEMRLDLEKKRDNVWDSWDGRLLEKWLEDVKRAIGEAEMDLSARFDPPFLAIVRGQE